MDRGTLLRYLPGADPTNVAVYLKPGVSLDEGQHAVERAIAGRGVAIVRNRTLRAQGIQVFDRTFAITYVLEALAVFVAITGVGGALLALVIDRRGEFGLLRFLGAPTGRSAASFCSRPGCWASREHRGRDAGIDSFAAADSCDQQTILRVDDSVPLARAGAAKRAFDRLCRDDSFGALPRQDRDAPGADRGDS